MILTTVSSLTFLRQISQMSFFRESVKFSSCAVLDLYPNAVSHLLKAIHSESNELHPVGLKNRSVHLLPVI